MNESHGFVQSTLTDPPMLRTAQAALGVDTWDAASVAGRALSREEALAEAWREAREARGEPEG